MGMRIEEVGDRIEIRRLVDEYALAVDTRDAERFAALFAADATLSVVEPDEQEPSLAYTGREELLTVVELVASFKATYHVMTNHVVQIDGDTATAGTYGLTHHLSESDERGLYDTLMLLTYQDELRRVDGRWRFQARRIERQWTNYIEAEKARLVG
ncbi:MAG: nuclear transport factor 2 family protein [Solirubrobacterales bacterium]